MRLKVMHLISAMNQGGAQHIVLDYLRHLKDDPAVELKLFVLGYKGDSIYDRSLVNEHLPVEYLNSTGSRLRNPLLRVLQNWIRQLKAVNRAIRMYQPDIIHTHITIILKHALLPTVLNHVPLRFNTLHSDPVVYRGLNLLLVKYCLRLGGFVPVCITEEQAEKAKKRYGIRSYELLRNGVDIEALQRARISRDEARERLQLPRDAFVLGSVGRLDKIKNYDFLLNVFAGVLTQKENALLVLAGDGEERAALEQQAQVLNIAHRVLFLGNREDVAVVYCALDVFVLPSRHESCSLVTLEAQTVGTRCVVSAGIPAETAATPLVRRLAEHASMEDWVAAILDDGYAGKVVCPLSVYDVRETTVRLKAMYLRYWSNRDHG
ncbi:putative glycosyltransferase EpsF [Sporotomaculum syntrophicum]|uniref:Glycosyltransferase EpsF n=1 Tax=Sporotomaculum syntrophicum TaxID=182264 RepID=A0A9D2WRG9_9FIRM|nr:glycosyltransferase [Sporotomaculum syntrophicum]KAF1086094.1 putative glycosyltransferase EpsF [Sporotomaculum syntrophicum]